jgi:hypothetical protein
MARQTRSGVAGMSMLSWPIASATALITAAGAPMPPISSAPVMARKSATHLPMAVTRRSSSLRGGEEPMRLCGGRSPMSGAPTGQWMNDAPVTSMVVPDE